jgi:hypothetical protein
LLHCWTWPNLLFWSVVPGHHIRHALPLQPGLAGLAALVWIAWLDGKLHWPLYSSRPGKVFLALIACWVIVKIAFVQIILPGRDVTRQARQKGEQIAALVPPGNLLHLSRVKDEGILFYYGRRAQRVTDPARWTSSGSSGYWLLVESEWQQWATRRSAEILLRLSDEQGKPLILIRSP